MKVKNLSDIPKAYNPGDVEDKWFKYWEDHKLYHSEVDESKEPYTVVIPPPNVTGMLTLGHVLNNTIQDVFVRYKRMLGYNACWVPGTDHASIATETKVVNFLKEKGIEKNSLSRDEFLKHCWVWTEKYGGIIIKQLKKLGVSCDWERERFTMDDHYYKKVIEAFVKLYKEGLIYRGYRMVNWDPASKSAISDEEVIFRQVNGKLWYFQYPVKDSDVKLVVATTRPETMLGDTGVAVNPSDERYKVLIGKKVILPIVGREIPIFADEYVDKEFGTGVVKVTPAHDINDYEMGQRHNLEMINIFNEDATTNSNVPKDLRELDRYEVRKKVVAKFEELGFIEKIEDYTNNVGYSERGGVPIEPYLSEQWFMRMDSLGESALKVVDEGRINFHPNHWVKTYKHWMENIKDWCISRQLYWGHRIPVWYHKETKEIYCEVEPPKDIENWVQEEDVLDTWASSWLWAQDVFTTKEDQKYYYPTNLLVTAPDIIFFWVARMIMAGMHFMNDIPFKDVYFTSVIRDEKGRKMSKSLGNSPDPLEVIDQYGADALRFTINYLAPLGQDVLFSTDKCEIGRNFANKIWNAARFLLMNAQDIELDESLTDKHIDFSDKWIESRFNSTIKSYKAALDKFDINGAHKIIYGFIWNDYCDWYLEMSKNRIYSDDKEIKSAVLTRSINLFAEMMKLLHPMMPYITEEIWQLLDERKGGESISTSKFPNEDESKIDKSAEEEIEFMQSVVTAIRNIRGEMNIPPSKQIDVYLKADKITEVQKRYIQSLVRVENLTVAADLEKPKASASSVVKGCDIYIPLEGLIDLDVERQRLEKEINRLDGLLNTVTKKLSNEKFVNNAPADVVEKEKTKQHDWAELIEKLKNILVDLN
ncbi:valyl-trna synthetase [hydrocarbon metagenome]|uniref:valine--tRNA ligase n=1 Tax=hydrocarbon metagenome TaxID=938273 RepID=A0A0W8FWS3_9ZZZZ